MYVYLQARSGIGPMCSKFTTIRMVFGHHEAEPSSQNNDRSRNGGTSRTKYLVGRACPSARRCCSCRICVTTPSHCGPRPMCGSNGLRICLATTFPLALRHGRLDQSARPIYRPISTTHRPQSARPICPCTLCSRLAHRTSHPTYEEAN